ncbi:MAG: CRISPR-associated protein Csx3 [Acaryochloris sp. CRU_2_0]|nr:CRISPR-associated protein Csx3 [Acaryochloris sp. CRU_2_0]
MTTFRLDLQESLLTVHYDPNLPAENDQIVKDVTQQLAQLSKQGLLIGGELLKITGKQTIPLSYVIAHHVGHLYGAIAVFDPKLQRYVVAITHSPNYLLGDCLP